MSQTHLNKTELKQKYLVKDQLMPYLKHYGNTREEQIKINQQAVKMLQRWRQEDARLSDGEVKEASASWEMVKQIIDDNRSCKLFLSS